MKTIITPQYLRKPADILGKGGRMVKPDKRENSRAVKIRIPAYFLSDKQAQSFFAEIENISKTGLGIICKTPFEIGTTLNLVTLTGTIAFDVVWSEAMNAGEQFYSIGLECQESSVQTFKKLQSGEATVPKQAAS